MKILVADDHAVMREGLLAVLSRLSVDVNIIQAASYSEVNSQCQKNPDVDLLLIDLTMPGDHPLTEINNILKKISAPLIVISASEDPENIQAVFDLGVKGFIPKSETNNVLLSAVNLVLQGGVYIPRQMLKVDAGNDENYTADITTITRRQKEVVNLLAMGKSNKEIANDLGLTEGTVRSHLVAVFRILNVQNRTQAGLKARQMGLLDKCL